MTTEERLERLERKLSQAKSNNRRLMIGAAVCLGMIFAWAFFAQPGRSGTALAESPTTAPAQKEIRARSFILEDEKGIKRAQLAVDLLGGKLPLTALSLYDEHGKLCVGVIATDAGPMLTLCDPNGKSGAMLTTLGLTLTGKNGGTIASLGASKDGPELTLSDDNCWPRVMLGIGKTGPSLCLGDEKGKPRIMLDVVKAVAGINLADETGKVRAGIGVAKDGAEVALADENGKCRVSLAAAKNGPALSLADEKGKDRAVLGTRKTETPDGKEIKYPESSLLLFGPDGKVRWTAP